MAQRYSITETVQKTVGLTVAGILQVGSGLSAQIKDLQGNNLTVYTSETGAGTTSNPVTTDANGRITASNAPLFVDAPDYDITVSGTGVTTYTEKIRHSPSGTFNVKSYGAKGDGTTDDTAAIQAATTAASGAKLVFPPTPGASYKVTSAITGLASVKQIEQDGASFTGAGALPFVGISQNYGAAGIVEDLDAWTPRPTIVGIGSDGSFNSADVVWQVAGFVTNTGTGPSVGVGGWGIGQKVWGGNFVGIGKADGDTAWGIEIDAGYNNSTGTGNGGGLLIVGTQTLAGGTYNGTAIRISAGDANSAFNQGIYFYSAAGTDQPVKSTGSLIFVGSNVSIGTAIDLSSGAKYTTAGIKIGLNSGSTASSSAIHLVPIGGFANLGQYILLQGAAGGNSGKYGLMFASSGGNQPITNAMIATSSLSVAAGIDLSGATFTGGQHAAIIFGEQQNLQLGTTTGTKIGTATSQLLGFFNATPVVQPSTTGTATGFTANSGTAVNDASTFTGGTGATAYRISDVVKALKNLGLLAA
jgi:hypothetical protein